MANLAPLLISAAFNIGAGLLLRALSPQPNILRQGPRPSDQGPGGATLGEFVKMGFGTNRQLLDAVDVPDPAIKVVVTETTSGGGKGGLLGGGGPTVTTRTFSGFITGRYSFGVSGASALLKLFAGEKVIFDATSAGPKKRFPGMKIIFYPGGPTQGTDPEEVARRGADIPAYQHLTTVKLEDMPIVDLGNVYPVLTGVVSYNSQFIVTFIGLVEPASGFDPPGNLSGSDATHMQIDPNRNAFYGLKGSTGGVWSATINDLTFLASIGQESAGNGQPAVGRDGFLYHQNGQTNATPLRKVDLDVGVVVAEVGGAGSATDDDGTRFGNVAGQFYQLSVADTSVGTRSIVMHLNGFDGSNGSLVDANVMQTGSTDSIFHVISTADGFPAVVLSPSIVISDHAGGRFLVFTPNGVGNDTQLTEVSFGFSQDAVGITIQPLFRNVRTFTEGDPGDDFPSGGKLQGFAFNEQTKDIILSNGVATILYNPDTDTILASRADVGFQTINNYYSGDIFGWIVGTATVGTVTVIDTRTLATVRTIDNDTIGWPGGDETAHEESSIWDDRTEAIIFSRVDLGSTAPVDSRVLKIFVNRVQGLDVGLDFFVQSIATSYQGMPLVGTTAVDNDVTELAGDSISMVIKSEGDARQALEAARIRYQFDGVQSDWKMKWLKRGRTPLFTIPAEDVGILKRDADIEDDPPIVESRDEDVILPKRVVVRYVNRDIDYNLDAEMFPRVSKPNPTMRSQNELVVPLDLVGTPQPMKELAKVISDIQWAERITFSKIIPWTHLEADPADEYNMTFNGETHRLRMENQDLGFGYAMDVTAAIADPKTLSSPIAGGANLGHVSDTIPDILPTRLIFLDAPVLDPADFNAQPISNAYLAFSPFGDPTQGAIAYRSNNNVDYEARAVSNGEAAYAKVKTAPGAWGFDATGDFRNRFQNVADGGSMIVVPIDRGDAFNSATERNVYNGANAFAVKTPNGIEIIQYQDKIDNGDGTLTFERLLRGRGGTEDIADLGGPIPGDELVLLTNATGIKETAAIQSTDVVLGNLSKSFFYKGVTNGTLIEDAQATSFTYTGRDLRPYSVSHITAELDGMGDLAVAWNRRTRGIGMGNWLDGTDFLPLNEDIEQYDVTLNSIASGDFITKTIDDATTAAFTSAEISGETIAAVKVVQKNGSGFVSPNRQTTLITTV